MQRITLYLSILILGLSSLTVSAEDAGLTQGIRDIQHEWAHIHYQLPEKQQADALIKQYPERAEPLVWKAVLISTHAGVKGGLGALGMVREARDLLEQAKQIDPNTLQGSIYTSLGSLYYQVPGWPLGFGSDKKAKEFLTQALAINPDGLDPNYFYGDFLYRKGHYSEALSVLEKAMHAPSRPSRPLADEGRRKEIQAVIAKIKDKT